MKNKIYAYIVIAIQIIILVLLLSTNKLTMPSGKPIHLQVSSSGILGLLNGNTLTFPLTLRKISTTKVETDASEFRVKDKVKVVVSPQGRYWQAVFVGKGNPAADIDSAILPGKIKSVLKSPGYVIEYKANGRLLSSTYVGKLRDNPKSGDRVMLRFDPNNLSRIEQTLPYMIHENRVVGEIVTQRQVLTKEFTYELIVQFKVKDQTIRAGYITKIYSPLDLPSRGTKVIVSYVREGDSYKITFLDHNPLTVGTVTSLVDVYELNLEYEFEKHHLTNKVKKELYRVGEELRMAEVSVDVIVGKWGRIRISTLYLGDRAIQLNFTEM